MDRIGGEPQVVLDQKINLGESIIWDDQAQRLWWVDIHQGEVHSWKPLNGELPQAVRLAERVGAIALRQEGGIVAALASGFAFVDSQTGQIDKIINVDSDLPTARLNDGRVDAAGRFVCGGMDEATPQRPISSVHALSPDGSLSRLIEGVTCANSICWSPDGRTLYFTDMPTRRIDAFDYDVETGDVGSRRLFADLAGEKGWADGSTVDAEGYLWNAQWGGGKIVRYAPDGRVDRELLLPIQNPTCVAFGGPDLDILFITTAWFGLSSEERADQPHAGSLFAVKPGVRGRPEHRFGQ